MDTNPKDLLVDAASAELPEVKDTPDHLLAGATLVKLALGAAHGAP